MKMFLRIIPAALVLCLTLLTTIGSAQTSTTGSIEGTVTDVTGAVVPGATVKAASPNLIRAQTVISDSQGRYRFANLPPGRYTIVVEAMSGFAKFEQANVDVYLSKTTAIEIKLQAQGTSATVEVVANTSPAIDLSSNTTGTNVTTEQFSNLPTQRTVQSLYTIAPTVSRSGLRDPSGRDSDPSVGGSSGPENNYILDGINTTDPAFGGSGANLPFEFVQEVEVKTGAVGAEYGNTTGGIFNVITKSGTNEYHGDAFFYGNPASFVRETKFFSSTGAAQNGFSEMDGGFDLGGPIKKDKLWFFGAFNPQRRENRYLTQTLREEVDNTINSQFYAGKVTYGVNQNHTLTFSTFGDFAKMKGFLQTGLPADRFDKNGFGADPNSFRGERQTGGHNYGVRMNSTFSPNFIGEFAFGLHYGRVNTIPDQSVASAAQMTDTFAVVQPDGTVAPVTTTDIAFAGGPDDPTTPLEDESRANVGLLVGYVNSPGGSLQRNYIRQGFGLFGDQDRNRWELSAKFQNNYGRHTFKYGFSYARNIYNITSISTGPAQTFGNPLGLALRGGADNLSITGSRITNSFGVCTSREAQIVCPNPTLTAYASAIAAHAGYTGGAITGNVTTDEYNTNPFLVLTSVRVRDFKNIADTHTNVESFYLQDEFKVARNLQLTGGLRFDYQQGFGNGGVEYIKLNQTFHNMQPRVGLMWDFTGSGRGKFFVNYAKFLETPIPLDLNVRAGSENSQTDKNFNVNQLGATDGSNIVPGIRPIGFTEDGDPLPNDQATGAVNLGASPTPIDPGIRPPTVHEVTMGVNYEIVRNMTIGVRGIYRAQGDVIEDGSFDDGDTYFLFNPGRRYAGSTEELACTSEFGCFGRARRYYRALEFTATRRFANNWQLFASYVWSSLIGNYEGLFRNDTGQLDPNITSLFDLVSLLGNTYGRLPNDRPHQFKLDGTYRWPFKLTTSVSFRAQSGIPFDALIPHPVYGDDEGFEVPRGTAINPLTSRNTTPRIYNMDLGLAYPIALGEGKEFRIQLDWFNLTNPQSAVRQDTSKLISSNVDGVPNIPNPFFGQGTIFQPPSALRLGLKFKF
jgi:outer membrane receptor protein involved in Fe transport